MAKSIVSSLIACLPNESKDLLNENKELLNENKNFISTSTSKPPMFNYATFCKVLSICEIGILVGIVLQSYPVILKYEEDKKRRLENGKRLVISELVKMFTNQNSSLKKLIYRGHAGTRFPSFRQYSDSSPYYHLSFTYFSGMRDLSELCCGSNLPSDFFSLAISNMP